MRTAFWIAVLPTVALALAACGDGGGAGTDAGAGDGEAGARASCGAIEEIESYRYVISLKLQSPAFAEDDPATPSDPLGGFAEALTELFSDMEMEGAYVAPDRSQVLLRFAGEELELRTIGQESWVRMGTTWQQQEPSSEAGGLLTPDVVCQDIVADLASSLTGVEPSRETVNGIETDHYELDGADLKRLPELLGTDPDAALPESFAVDLWLARDGRWPVRLSITASDTDEEGQPTGLDLFMEFLDINDPDIEIQPPVVSPAGT